MKHQLSVNWIINFKRNKKYLLIAFFFVFSTTGFAQVKPIEENPVGILKGLQYEIDITKDPNLGYVPKSRLVEAYQVRQARITQLNLTNRAMLFGWTERGSYSDAVGPSNGNTRPGNGKTSGRMRAVWVDLADATGKTVWVGGIDGGLWKTTDITANPATWIPINDFFGNLAVSTICQDPSNTNIMYFGTGEKAINADAVRGAGVWRSLDHGVTWTVMAGTSLFWNVSKMICDASGNLYVGNNSMTGTVGMQRFNKIPQTWNTITPTGLASRITDIELSTTGKLHISCGYFNTPAASAGYRFTSAPATVASGTWTSPTTTFPTQYNVDLASKGDDLYALSSNSSWQVPTIYKSTNGGVNWAATGTTPAFTSGQSWYNMAVAVDPTNSNNVVVGALDCYKSVNGGTSWTQISNWVGTVGQYVHADQQAMDWRSNNQLLIASDGGIHYSANGGTTITDRNVNLRIKQFYSVAIHPTSTNYFLGGTQDNGTHQFNGAGLTTTVEVTGGDGAFVHIDQNQGQFQWGSYVFNQYRRSINSGSTWTSVNFSSSAGRFINPTDYDDVNNIMYCSGNANTYIRWDNPQSGSTFTTIAMAGLGGNTVSAVKVSPFTANTVYFGGGSNGGTPTLIKADNANTAAPTFTSIISAAMQVGSTNLSSIEFGTTQNDIVVTFSNYGINNVWVTTNGGTSWTAIDGTGVGALPDMPVRWAMFYPNDNTKVILATETGIWQTELVNGAATIWDPETSFPNVRVDMLQYRASDRLLAAATHGRGLFTTIVPADLFVKDDPADFGAEPNPLSSGVFWASPDIWVCNTGFNATCLAHTNPTGSNPNTIRINVNNRGGLASDGTERLLVYWAKASTGLGWDNVWLGTAPLVCITEPTGGYIGTINIPAGILPGSSQTLSINWTPPDPSNYNCFGADKTHFCLLARIETSTVSPFGMTFPETTDLWLNVKNNNNIAWKNVSITDLNPLGPGIPPPPVVGQNNTTVLIAGDKFSAKKGRNTRLDFRVPEEEIGKGVEDFANIHIDLGQFFDNWRANGMRGKGFKVEVLRVPVYINEREYIWVEKTLLKLTAPDAYVEGIDLDPETIGPIGVMVTQTRDYPNKDVPLHLDVIQNEGESNNIVGGENYEFRLMPKLDEKAKPNISEAIANPENNLKMEVAVGVASKIIRAKETPEVNGNYFVEVWDYNGRQLVNKNMRGNIEINANSWAKGIYVIRITNTDTRQVMVKKVVL